MKKIALTPRQHGKLQEIIRRSQQNGHYTAKEGFQSGAEQDGHHDEGYQLSLRETAIHDARTKELQLVLDGAEVVVPEEQSSRVQFGAGLVLKYKDGSLERFILDGYSLPGEQDDRTQTLSLSSPLGKLLIGAKVGEERILQLGARKVPVTIEKIVPPSKVDDPSSF